MAKKHKKNFMYDSKWMMKYYSDLELTEKK